MPDDSIINAYKSANFVFEGKVIKIDTILVLDTSNVIYLENPEQYMVVTYRKYLAVQFSIKRVFKGHNQGELITIMTAAVGTLCGYQFERNYNYLVYGYSEQFNLVVDKNYSSNKSSVAEGKTLRIERYSTSSCTRTTITIKSEISELKNNKLI